MGDIASTYGAHFKSLFKDNDRLNYLVNTLIESKDEEIKAIGDFVIGEVNKLN